MIKEYFDVFEGKGIFVYFEFVFIFDEIVRKEIFGVFGKFWSVGLNEVELVLIMDVMGEKIFVEKFFVYDLVDLIVVMKVMFKFVEKMGVRRIYFYIYGYYLVLIDYCGEFVRDVFLFVVLVVVVKVKLGDVRNIDDVVKVMDVFVNEKVKGVEEVFIKEYGMENGIVEVNGY